MDRGSFIDHGGRPAVRFQRTYPYPIEHVWKTISDPAEIGSWFPSTVTYEPRTGGTIGFSDDPHLEPTTGTVLAFDPPHRFWFTWSTDEVHLELESVDDGHTTLTLTNVLGDRDAAARNAAGWDVCLAELDKVVAGKETRGPHESDTDWQQLYDDYAAGGMPAGAWIPSDPAAKG